MYQIIRELEADNSRLAKEAIIEREKNNIELLEGIQLALSPYITFGVKKVPSFSGPDGQGLPWEAFKELCELLATRQLTGDDARSAIELALSASTAAQWNDWYRRILIKDLRCGVSEKTVNKIVKGAVPVFECMLAHDGANHEKKIKGVKLLEPKLDGVRCVTIVDYSARTVVQYTRNGKVLENFSHITDSLLTHIDNLGRSYVLDGEVVSDSFQTLMKQVHRKDDVQSGDARLMLFDMIPLSEFKEGKSTLGQRRRTNLLRSFKSTFDKCGNIDIIPQIEVNLDEMVGEVQFKEFNKEAIEKGFEGIMIKDPNAMYECKRSASWLKMKPFIEVSLTVLETEEGTGKNEGKMGALVCEGTEDGKLIKVNVGSGFTDEDRDEFWSCKVDGQVVEVRADAITQNQDGTYSLRFPRFLRFRGFAAGEKI
ncbi:MAG: ATP-dependent DNA ligase [Thermoleophilia bacterium]|jgi:DNA ligase-1